MKIGLYSDPHFSQSSSIISGRKGDFSGRLSNLIESFQWMNQLFKDEDCEEVFCLGDLTDKPNLSAEEITALSRCNLESHRFIVGNHCRVDACGEINSLSMLKHIYYEPSQFNLSDGTSILILPYSSKVFDLSHIHTDIILSHNDIKGYVLENYVCDTGYNIDDIKDHCRLFINGHLHNGGWVLPNRIMNLGQLSGMNFSSCGGQWEPSVAILDTTTLEVTLYENPCAYRFKKSEFSTLTNLKNYLDSLPDVGHYVIRAKVPEGIAEKSRKLLDQCSKVEASRVITYCKVSKKGPQKKELTHTASRSVYDKLRDFVNKSNPKVSVERVNQIIDKISKLEDGEE